MGVLCMRAERPADWDSRRLCSVGLRVGLSRTVELMVMGIGDLLVWEAVFRVGVVGGSLCGGSGHLGRLVEIKD